MLHSPGDLPRDALQRNVAIGGGFVADACGLALGTIGEESFFRAEDHVARRAVFQLADVAGPLALLQELDGFARERRSVLLEANIEAAAQILDKIRNVVA